MEVEVGSATINKSFLLGHPDPRKTQGFPDWSLDFISNEVSVQYFLHKIKAMANVLADSELRTMSKGITHGHC